MSEMYKNDVEAADALKQITNQLKAEISKVIVGQDHVVEGVLTSIFCNGHSLLIGVPGLAKTLLINTIADVLDLSFNRIQFTPDLMPSDITGSEILDEERNFKFSKGPLFANIVLADEINRTPPKTQAALLEAMQEKTVTIAGHDHQLPKPFFVLATQNPIEQEGTYPLPEAQLDRFMFNITLDYPSEKDEIEIVKRTTGNVKPEIKKVISAKEIIAFQELVRNVPIADNVLEYAVKLVGKTRPNLPNASEYVNQYLGYGAGPRASQNLVLAAKCNALMKGKYSPDIEDVKSIANYVLRHRLVKNYKAEAEGISVEDIIGKLL
ncbi:MAG: MoxR family ATPase [Bacteroidetes bacterium]|jgi:MoxR-like ATPase|nr:MoxR family ATPase [Bacteroidota bacterium]